MPGEITQKHQSAAPGALSSKQYITVENREGGGMVADVGGIQTTGMGNVIEHPPRRALLVQHLLILAPNMVTLVRQCLVQPPHTIKRVDLRFKNHAIVGFDEKVVAAGLKTPGQIARPGQGGEKDERHQALACQSLDLTSGLHSVHPRHQGVQQHQIRLGLPEQIHRLGTVFGFNHGMAQAAYQPRQNQPVAGTVLGKKYLQGNRLSEC